MERKNKKRTKSKVTKFLPPLHVLALLDCRLYAADHHGTDTNCHHLPKLGAVDRHDLSRVLAVHVQGCTNSLRLRSTKISGINLAVNPQTRLEKTHIDSIILSSDIRHPPDPTLHRRMEPMVVLRGQAEDG